MRPKSKNKSDTYANGAKKSTSKKYDARPLQIKKRSELNKKNREEKTAGNRDGKDWAHKKGGGWKKESESKNRAWQGSGKRGRYSP
tara:strand:- start:236 stop:493 length:258 start_codon:yes stop_codon:yes gene_type:complete